MAEAEILQMSTKELKRLKVIQEVLHKRLPQIRAAELLSLSDRQIRRMVARMHENGEKGLIHRLRGRPSSRRIGKKVQGKLLGLYQKRLDGFGPTLAVEKLSEMAGIVVSRETLRQWLMEAGLWHRKKPRGNHRRWRERKACFGEMIQMDGSHHAWLESRGPKLVLMGYIDDATGNVYGRFYDYEGTLPAMDSFKRYIQQYGLPISVYLDRHSTYKSTKKLPEGSEDTELPLSQFERALKELGVDVIHAYSPQAKGRVERLFGILQDRLVKEMRLVNITTKEQANQFLQGYWPRYNQRFVVQAAHPQNVHIKPQGRFDADRYLCIKNERTVASDHTITYKGKLYQIHTPTKVRQVVTQERVDGSLHIMHGPQSLRYTEITNRPEKFFNEIHPTRGLGEFLNP